MCRVGGHLLCTGWVGICCVQGGWAFVVRTVGRHLLCVRWVGICCVQGGWVFAVCRVSICCGVGGHLLCTWLGGGGGVAV